MPDLRRMVGLAVAAAVAAAVVVAVAWSNHTAAAVFVADVYYKGLVDVVAGIAVVALLVDTARAVAAGIVVAEGALVLVLELGIAGDHTAFLHGLELREVLVRILVAVVVDIAVDIVVDIVAAVADDFVDAVDAGRILAVTVVCERCP